MKRMLCLFVVPVSVGLLTSCVSSKAEVVNNGVNMTVPVGTVQTDVRPRASLSLAKGKYSKKDKYCEVSIEAEWPSGPDAVSAAIRRDLLVQMDTCLAYDYMDREIPLYKGDLSSPQVVVNHYGEHTYKLLLDMSRENHQARVETEHDIAAENGEKFQEPEVIPLVKDMEIKKDKETSKWCLFKMEYYWFTGGAHGVENTSYHTYDKATGRRFTDFIRTDALNSMQPLLRAGLKEYFVRNGEKLSDKELDSYLLLEGKMIPLPSNSLYPSSKGLVFCYDSYEIAPYAAGQPSFTIQYDRIKPYMTAAAIELLGL
ncbi:MAG: RsiV family protein [Prevotellaceae bacterium]|nr:RsiV family protein [Prevotellaceae bacterium]MDO4932697.1 RsiV family protein [Prevotellaceae bacterium]